jgi:pilus assembly protein CpaC
MTMQIIRPAALRRLSAAGLPIFVIAVFGGTTLQAQQPEPVLTTASTAMPVAVPEPATPDTVRLLVGRSTLVDLGQPIARVSLTSSDVADALVTSPSQLLVHGKVPGSISMFVWSRGGDVRRFEVAVQRDLTRLTDQFKQLFPNENIQVHGNGRNVVLSGTVSGKDVVDRAIGVALGYVEKKDDVVTLLQVREGRVSNQVLLKVRFAEVSRSALTEFGISYFTSPTGIRNTVGRVTTQQFPSAQFSDLAWTKSSSRFGDPVTSAEGKISFADFLNVFLLNQKWDLGVAIRAMQDSGVFQSLAEPNLVAESGKEASFLAGGEFPVPIVQGSGQNMGISVQFKEFGIRLNFTPTVNGDRVHLKVRPEVSTLDYGNGVAMNGFRIPALSTRRAETELELANGQTFAVAGLMNNQLASSLQKIPGLGDIPILGHLFRSRAAQKDQTELVVMITPEILATDSVGVTNALPRTPDSFMAPLPEPKTKAPLPPAFTPDRQSTVSVPVPSKAAQIEQKDQREKAEAERDRLAAEARATAEQEARANAAAAKQAIDEAKRAEAEAKAEDKRVKEEQKRQEKEARERAKKEQEAARKAARSGSPQASAGEGTASAPAASLQQGDAVQQAVDSAAAQQAENEEQARARAIAEAKQRALEAASQTPAQVEK